MKHNDPAVLIKHLKLVRDAAIDGNGQEVCEQFFDLYHFDDTRTLDWREVER